jgi:hypothetical protein
MKKAIFLLLFTFLGSNNLKLLAQDISYARACIKTLCSEPFYGRGYVQNGDKVAAQFIRQELAKQKVIPLGEKYFQNLGFHCLFV